MYKVDSVGTSLE